MKFLRGRGGRAVPKLEDTVVLNIQGEQVAMVCDCIPASMSVAAARELIGQPFLSDYQMAKKLSPGVAGPVHLIACQKSVSESQALRQLGFPISRRKIADLIAQERVQCNSPVQMIGGYKEAIALPHAGRRRKCGD
jgi:hypothetical protein